jgi:hypothetical protein
MCPFRAFFQTSHSGKRLNLEEWGKLHPTGEPTDVVGRLVMLSPELRPNTNQSFQRVVMVTFLLGRAPRIDHAGTAKPFDEGESRRLETRSKFGGAAVGRPVGVDLA